MYLSNPNVLDHRFWLTRSGILCYALPLMPNKPFDLCRNAELCSFDAIWRYAANCMYLWAKVALLFFEHWYAFCC